MCNSPINSNVHLQTKENKVKNKFSNENLEKGILLTSRMQTCISNGKFSKSIAHLTLVYRQNVFTPRMFPAPGPNRDLALQNEPQQPMVNSDN